MEMERFTFFRSFYEAFSDFDDADRLDLYDSLMQYVFEGVEPSLSGFKATVFKLVLPNLKASLKRSQTNAKNASKNERENESEATEKTSEKTTAKTTVIESENDRKSETKANAIQNMDKDKEKKKDRDTDKEGVFFRPQYERKKTPPPRKRATCPVCGVGMTFELSKHRWVCPMCGSKFDEGEVACPA